MMRLTKGNLLDDKSQALVNTVNTVGVMGKGIALMFKEAFPNNYRAYVAACKNEQVQVGRMFVTERENLIGPKWIINFPTKKHWRQPTKIEWIEAGLKDLAKFIVEHDVRSVAIPPLGSGNGGLDWEAVRELILQSLSDLQDVEIVIYEPTEKYQNVAKREGVENLTPARALVAELVRQYWVLGIECTLLEIQKLAWFLERNLERLAPDNPLKLDFSANKFGPYANRLSHLLNSLDGSYLHCDRRIADAGPLDIISFEDTKKNIVLTYLKTAEARPYIAALNATKKLIDGFQSPFGMELLATVDWLLLKESCSPDVESVKAGISQWPGGADAAKRKQRLFSDRSISIALKRLSRHEEQVSAS